MRKPTREDHRRRMAAYREANKRWPLPVSGTGLEPKATKKARPRTPKGTGPGRT